MQLGWGNQALKLSWLGHLRTFICGEGCAGSDPEVAGAVLCPSPVDGSRVKQA